MIRRALAIAGTMASAGLAVHQAGAQPAASLPDVNVVGTTPLLGSGIARDDVPAATQVLGSADVVRTGIPDLTGAILDNIASATVNDTEGNPFQPDVLFRGFTASPTAGAAQGLAVYVNGARFNDAFGDTVNWDLIPSAAIESVNVEASNPVFGLNALGGSVNVQTKNGFTYNGASLTAYGGSYDRGSGIAEYGHQWGNVAFYGTGEIAHDGGYRQTQASDIYRLLGDLGWRNDVAEAHLIVTAADNTLGNPGATPVQALAVDRSAIFTAPNDVYDKYVSVNANGSWSIRDDLSVQGVAYYQTLTQRVPNGITEEVEGCDTQPGTLCFDDGTPVIARGGGTVPDYLNGGVYSGLSQQGLDTHSYGASAQLTAEGSVAGYKNHLVAGASFDGSDSVFDGSQAIGGFDPYTRAYVGPGYVVEAPDEGINSVRIATTTRFYGLFAQDVLTLAPGLDLNLAGRFNNAETDLHDKLGGKVSGQHSYSRFDPSVGLTWQALPGLQLYASYSETNRTPTPQELSCASPATPCSLLNFFVGDPNLKQVVARTVEAGARGHVADFGGGKLTWNADYFRTQNRDDLIYQTTLNNPNADYFTNAGQTLRQGVEAGLRFDTPRLHVVIGYSWTDAVFQTPLVLDGGSNPAANAEGLLLIMPGDRIPGIPQHRGTILVDYKVTPEWIVGGNVILQSSAYRFGDEANLTKPVGGYGIVNLHTSYQITRHVSVFALLNNALDQRYETYGSFGPVGDVPWPLVPGGVTDPRTASPGQPISAYGGVRIVF